MAIPAERDPGIVAVLHPTGAAVRARAASVIVVYHDPITDPRFPWANSGTDFFDDAAGLMPFDDDLILAPLGLVEVVQVATAHSGRLDPYDNLIRTGNWIGIVPKLHLPLA
jgi:hypothetical protein